MPAELDIEVPRNGNYFKGWTLTDDQNAPLDITGWALKLQIKAVAGSGPVIANATFSGRIDAQGFFNVRINGADFSAVDGPMETVKLAYDFLATDIAAIPIVETRGHIYLTPGVTT